MKQPSNPSRPRRGMMLAEACVALTLIGMILGLASVLLIRYSRAADYYLNYRRVQLGVESQIERLRAGALSVADAPFEDEGGITYTVTVLDAPASWQPLTQVNVTGEYTARHGRVIQAQASAMIDLTAADQESPP
ncbi:MAG: hypothetical protein C4547_08970 [Phycisphaerales bacterium]|nr:MAG: hypothetical protein C4547_08970 [Phycisphaerales bacterium]